METWEAGREHLLELLSEGASLEEVLMGLCTFVESKIPEALCSVLLLDPDGQHLRHGAGPRLPEAYLRAVDGLAIGPNAGSCGTAAFLGHEVVVEEIANHPLWAEGRELALTHHLAACASTPIFGPGRSVLGTFALYHPTPGPFQETELRLLRSVMGLAAIAIQVNNREVKLRQTEDRFAAMVRHSSDFVSLNDPEGRFRYISPTGAAFFGFSPEELVGRTGFDFVHPEDLPKVLQYHLALQGGEHSQIPMVFRARSADGTWRWLEVLGSTCADEVLGLATVLNGRDITEQKRLEDELRASETRMRAIVQAIPDFYFRARADGTILDFHFNDMPLAFGQWNPVGHRFQDAPMPEEIKTNVETLAAKALHTGAMQVMEYHISMAAGEFEREARICPSGKDELVVFVRDITQQKHGEAELRRRLEAERLIATLSTDLMKSAPEGIDAPIGRALAALGRFANVDRCHINQISPGGTFFDRTHEWCAEGIEPWITKLQGIPCDAFPEFMGHLRRMEDIPITHLNEPSEKTNPEREHFKLQGIRSSLTVPMSVGQQFQGFLSFDVVQVERRWCGEDLKILRLAAELFASALERRRMDKALKLSEQQYRDLVEQQGEGVLSVDPEERVTFANPAAEAVFGIPLGSLPGRSIREFVTKEEFAKVLQQTEIRHRGIKSSYELVIRRPDGQTRTLLVSASPHLDAQGHYLGANGIFLDITERKRLEERMERIRMHEGLAMVVGGVAHNINNLLASIQGNAELVRLKEAGPEPFLDNISCAVQRAADLSRQMLTSVGCDQASPESIDINRQIAMIKYGFANAFPTAPAMVFELTPGLAGIEVPPQHFHQVIHALVSNACEAIGNQEGRITIATGQALLSAEDAARLFSDGEMKPGSYVTLEVRDTGCGMEAVLLPRIFDLFFSTKFIGRGLGLATVRGILKACGGGIRVQSEPGMGASFMAYFPAVEMGVAATPVPEIASTTPFIGKILIVDDEDLLRESQAEILRFQGFQVMEAANGQEAVDLFRVHGNEIAVILMDLSMPRMDGYEAFQAIRRIDPHARIILSSGYAEQDAMRIVHGSPFSAFLQKPYKFETLRAALDKVLATPDLKQKSP